MGIWRALALVLAGALFLPAQSTVGWQLIWSDEFSGTANAPPDPTKWSYDTGNGTAGWGNGELEDYTSSTNNVFQDGNGNLVIRALSTGTSYTSGRIKTAGKFSFTYGMVEVRAKIPYAQGIWPAIWMLGANYPAVPWPDSGEIDLMENFGVFRKDASTIRAAIHGQGDTGAGIAGTYVLPGGAAVATDFHVFAAQWSPAGVVFFVDGTPYLNIPSGSMLPSWQAALANPFFLLFDVAVGGNPVGIPDPSTLFPQQMLVDYVRVYQSSSQANLFVPITPCRVADTRNAPGAFGGPSIDSNTSRDFLIANSACAIPANATAFSMNVAVVPRGPLGFLTVWPAGQTRPTVATLNSDGRVKSNAAIVPAGPSGGISIFATDSTDVVLDINGYFLPASAQTGLAFYPLAPCRVADTRNASGPLGGPKLAAGNSRTFPVLSACNLPLTAQAYSLNFAAVPTGPLGYLTAWPTGQPQPFVASLNAVTGSITANAVIVPAGAAGSIDVYTTGDTDLVVDINGYFASPGPGGSSLFIEVPCRVLDTRLTSGLPSSGVLSVPVAGGPCAAATGALAFVFNATVVPPAPLGYLTMWPQGQSQPVVATLNATDAAITSNLAITPSSNGAISVFLSSPAHLVLDLFGFFAP